MVIKPVSFVGKLEFDPAGRTQGVSMEHVFQSCLIRGVTELDYLYNHFSQSLVEDW